LQAITGERIAPDKGPTPTPAARPRSNRANSLPRHLVAAFKRPFNLADYVQVRGATFDNGLLQIELVREIPEAKKPRRIAINGSPASNIRQLETKGRPDRQHSAAIKTSAADARRGGLPVSCSGITRCMDAMHLAPCCAVKIRVCEAGRATIPARRRIPGGPRRH
jgi:hypothetical protein